QPPQSSPPAGMGGVGMWACVDQAVPVRWSAALVAALLAHLGLHRGQCPEPGPLYLSFGVGAEQHDQRLVDCTAMVERAVGLRQPQLLTVFVEMLSELDQLVAAERPLVLPDDYRVDAAARLAECGQQRSGARPVCPCRPSGESGVEVLGDDLAVPSDQLGGCLSLPRT